MSVQSSIESALPSMPPSLARIAALVQANPGTVVGSTISELAEQAGTSVASVSRFCHAIGIAGYASLRMALATELGKEAAQFSSAPGYGADISGGDSPREMATKIASLEILAIEETLARIDFDELERVADALDRAERILLFGVGASQFVAQDLGHKLLRVGRNVNVVSDSHEAVSLATLATEATAVMGFSHLGETAETLKFLDVAKTSGATTVGVTGVKTSSIVAACDHVLFTEVRETAFRAGAMVSRIAQLAVVDWIFVAVARHRYQESVEALRRTRDVTRPRRGA